MSLHNYLVNEARVKNRELSIDWRRLPMKIFPEFVPHLLLMCHMIGAPRRPKIWRFESFSEASERTITPCAAGHHKFDLHYWRNNLKMRRKRLWLINFNNAGLLKSGSINRYWAMVLFLARNTYNLRGVKSFHWGNGIQPSMSVRLVLGTGKCSSVPLLCPQCPL